MAELRHDQENLSLTAISSLVAATQALTEAVKILQGQTIFSGPLSLALHTRGIALSDLINEFLLSKERARKSDRYLRQARVALSAFARGRAQRPIATITSMEIEDWLNSQAWKDRTRRTYLIDVRTLFNFAVKRGYLTCNPALAVDLPPNSSEPPIIHTPEQVRRVLAIAQATDLDVCRCLSIRYFAGLRASEAATLDESEIGTRYIEVKAAKAKTRRRRLVPISDNLRAWLDLGGELPLHQANNCLALIGRKIKDAGIPWGKNATRHSFCSYHLALYQSAARTALEAGHSEAMLFAHYRELVTPEAAREFFSITPPA